MKDFNRDLVTSWILKAGVITSITLIIAGIIIIFVKGGSDGESIKFISNYYNSSATLSSNLIHLGNIPHGLVTLDGVYFVTLGLWILIFTPITVVVTALISFYIEKNWLYILLSCIVLFDLLFAMLVVPIFVHF